MTEIDVSRIERDIERIGSYSESRPEVGYSRPTFSTPWVDARDYVIGEVEKVGGSTRIDGFGNVHARGEAFSWEEPLWLSGSHVDSVPSGGKYDGVSGVVSALELLRIGAPVELIIFAEEEGTTFGLGMLGSRGWVGTLSAEELGELRNRHGESFLEAGRDCGVDPARMAEDRLDPGHYHGFIELHPEQGLSLWNGGRSVAAVDTINGRRQYTVTIRGQGNHAGSTRMGERRDALAAAAEAITSIEELGRTLAERLDYTVMTVGKIDVQANAVNVIAGTVVFTVDFRAQNQEILNDGESFMSTDMSNLADERSVEVSFERNEDLPPAPLDHGIVSRLHRAAEAIGVDLTNVPSGALHDSAIVAPILPTAMLFIPSRDGVSHDPSEFSRVEDVAAATRIVAGAMG